VTQISSYRDGITIAKLSGHVSLVVTRKWPRENAVESLRTLVADRADLLAQWSGLLLGGQDPRRADWPGVVAQIRLLIDAGAQVDAVPGWALIGRQRQGSWAAEYWPPVPTLAEALGGPVAQIRHDAADEGRRDGWWHLVVHPLPFFRYGQDPYPAMAREFGRVRPDGLGFGDRRHIRDDHRVVFGMRCRDAFERLERARAAITPLLPHGTTTTLT
jgi:hypothetical protein